MPILAHQCPCHWQGNAMIHSMDSNCSQQTAMPTSKHIDHKCVPTSYTDILHCPFRIKHFLPDLHWSQIDCFHAFKSRSSSLFVNVFWKLSMVLSIIFCLRITTLPQATKKLNLILNILYLVVHPTLQFLLLKLIMISYHLLFTKVT